MASASAPVGMTEASGGREALALQAQSRAAVASGSIFAAILTLCVVWAAPLAVFPFVEGVAVGFFAGWGARRHAPRFAVVLAAAASVIILVIARTPQFRTGLSGPDVQDRLLALGAHLTQVSSVVTVLACAISMAAIVHVTLSRLRISDRFVGRLVLVAALSVLFVGATVSIRSTAIVSHLTEVAAYRSPATQDEELFAWVLQQLSEGEVYYPAMARGLHGWGGSNGSSSAFTVRLPYLFHLWHFGAGGRIEVVAWMVLALVMAAIAAAYALVDRYAGELYASLAVLSLVPLGIGLAGTRLLLLTETWAGLLLVCSLWAWSARDQLRGRVVLAAALAVAAFTCREFAAAILAAGVVAAVLEQRRRDLAVWLVASALAVAVEVAHFGSVYPYLQQGSMSIAAWLNAGPDPSVVWEMMFTGSGLLLFHRVLAPGAFLLSLMGALLFREPHTRAMYSMATVVPPAVFLFVHLNGVGSSNWGLAFAPMLFALWPLGLAAITAMLSQSTRSTAANQ